MPVWLRRALTGHVLAQKTADNQDMTRPLPVYKVWLKCQAQVNGVNNRAETSKRANEKKSKERKTHTKETSTVCRWWVWHLQVEMMDRGRQMNTPGTSESTKNMGEGRRMCTWCNGQKHPSFLPFSPLCFHLSLRNLKVTTPERRKTTVKMEWLLWHSGNSCRGDR